MKAPLQQVTSGSTSREIRVRGRVQGVGFRPMIWRLARELGLRGIVRNDPGGVIIQASGAYAVLDEFMERIRKEAPPLAVIENIESRPIAPFRAGSFRIGSTIEGKAHTEVTPDASVCVACAAEVLARDGRRAGYPFANCTDCGPRLSIVTAIPYDRANTTMAEFELCEQCAREYEDPSDRRFHAQAIACPICGPTAKLVWLKRDSEPPNLISVEGAAEAIARGFIVAIKGLGGYQLACDATNRDVVARLRRLKRRPAKPFALMACDLDLIRRYCEPTPEEERLLTSKEAPIVLIAAADSEFAEVVAPAVGLLGFMLPTTPLHLLLLRTLDRPIVLTSGNISDEPQITDDDEALKRLPSVADAILLHDRKIAIRVDDSVARIIDDKARLLRRARGYAPAPIKLPQGFESAPQVLALGGDLKSTFCLTKGTDAVVSQHQGNLDSVATFDEFRRSLQFYSELLDHFPAAIVADFHPEYRSSKVARDYARRNTLPLVEIQHHHAHIASCLLENGRPISAKPVLGIVLDGLGWGEDGALWGGEFLLADYRSYQRVGTFKPVAMPGGDQAAREPWRNLYAHLTAEMSWLELTTNFAALDVYRYLERKPRQLLDQMIRQSINAPRASSCGRLFDAVAAAIGICRDHQSYEGEAAAALEALVDERTLRREDMHRYPFAIPNMAQSGLPYIEPLAMWRAVLGDLVLQTPGSIIAARFHNGLAAVVAAMTGKLAQRESSGGPRFDTVALSGGCFQNAVLLSEIVRRLRERDFIVLRHSRIPANDGGLSLGQAAVAAAKLTPRIQN